RSFYPCNSHIAPAHSSYIRCFLMLPPPRGPTLFPYTTLFRSKARILKLYNAGSFFDPRAVPDADYPAIVDRLDGFARLVVESHPALIGRRLDRLLELLDARAASGAPRVDLEVAMGLETTHASALEQLNKRMTVRQYVDAAARLAARGAGLRAFVLIAPPFVPVAERMFWLAHAVDTAFDAGASIVSLIPVHAGNGAMDQ